MKAVSRLPLAPEYAQNESSGARVETIVEAIKVLLKDLPQADQELVLREITDAISPIPAPRAGEVLGTIVRLLPRKRNWKVEEIKRQIEFEGVQARSKEIYNAMGYLTRRGHVQRVGYGQYIVGGIGVATSDDLGGEPTRNECE